MMTNKIIAEMGLFFALSGSAMILLSLIFFLLKREEYYYLIARYKEKYLFPAPASFHHMTGFFGAVIVIRFFIRLSHKKRILFMRHDDPACSFFDEPDVNLQAWMIFFYYLWVTATAFFVAAGMLSLLLP
ncbi:hypothetical protein HFD91_14545 [Enterobacteriaceae bacterium EKM102V]|nr:hypothetical protein HFD91_14545 [Enterobacteriaceae bacterium EKM102V]KAF6666954.1 hypothetical protein HFD97_13620 [Pantoea sp. EKM103V]